MKAFSRFYKTLLLIMCAFFLNACASKGTMTAPVISTHDFVAFELGQAIENAHSELASLSELRGQGVEVLVPPPDPRLSTPIQADWTTTASEALKNICLNVGYSYNEIGSTAQELPVIVYGNNVPTYELLEDIAYQIQPKAFVKVDTINQSITLAYPSGTN